MLNRLIKLSILFSLLSCKTNYLKYTYSSVNPETKEKQMMGFRTDTTFMIVHLPLKVFDVKEGKYSFIDKNNLAIFSNDGSVDTLVFSKKFNSFSFRNIEFTKEGKKDPLVER